jgi:para-aminobenzoate synthetase component 1
MSLLLQAVPYHRDSSILFETILHRPWSVFLDSGKPGSTDGRFDILAADPGVTLVTRGESTRITNRTGSVESFEDPFALVREALGATSTEAVDLPFSGGAIGYFGYDLGWRLERLPVLTADDVGMPDMAIGIYDWALVVDHQERQSWLVGQGRDPATREQWQNLVEILSTPPKPQRLPPLRLQGTIASNLSQQQYHESFQRIQTYIHDGDCYQVNFAQRFLAPVTGDPWEAYRSLRRENPAPYGAYLNLPQGKVLSCSPERFLQVRNRKVETKPIKGTRPRGAGPEEDRQLQEELEASAKDRAENLMIVDLLRNDLGKSCEPGSVTVPKMFEVESFATVHHLVSTVTGELAHGEDAVSLLRGCFPGSSITGTPKVRAMEIIEELEPSRRGVYCGAIGYLGFDGDMDTNIVIRTLLHRNDSVYFSAGGGIVADSEMESEYQESFDKAAALLRLLRRSVETS